ncbi:hypothetical protein BDY19DRAFT_24948 [Irpex rosettiformis]|uniref:Uncharacterized protein n=1 Tax=Irpex rosettiformis TaxID=378272 RepID=A0ACB8UJA9_9APHY|nr:hypothetical protein BDY19DRAFT_24948 [Irpex rosettiformis]
MFAVSGINNIEARQTRITTAWDYRFRKSHGACSIWHQSNILALWVSINYRLTLPPYNPPDELNAPSPPSRLPLLLLIAMSATYDFADEKEKATVDNDHDVVDVNAPDDSIIADRFAQYGRFGPVLQRIFASGVEARGVERVPEDQRETKHIWNKCVDSIIPALCLAELHLNMVAC